MASTIELFNFRSNLPIELNVGRSRLKLPDKEFSDDYLTVVDPYWQPEDYVPNVPHAHALLASNLILTTPFQAVMRVLTGLEPSHWPSGFDLLWEEPEAVRAEYDRLHGSHWWRYNAQGCLVPSAIDPEGCGCTECIIHEYYPLDEATPAMLRDMIAGYIGSNTYEEYWISFENSGGTWRQVIKHAWIR